MLTLLDQMAPSRPLTTEEESRRDICFSRLGDYASVRATLALILAEAERLGYPPLQLDLDLLPNVRGTCDPAFPR